MAAPRKYPDEFRERAIREVHATGRPIAHVAKDLGIHKERLRGRVRRAEADHGERGDRLTTQGFGVVAGRPVHDGPPGWPAGESGTGTASKIM
ncbi:transposase, partial [Streptomyces kaempferi]